jgi:hypothetical protein
MTSELHTSEAFNVFKLIHVGIARPHSSNPAESRFNFPMAILFIHAHLLQEASDIKVPDTDLPKSKTCEAEGVKSHDVILLLCQSVPIKVEK